MSLENQYIQRGEEEIISEAPKKTKKSSPKVENESTSEKASVLEKFSQRWDKKRASTITGALLICISFYCLLACVSYLFTWQVDQNRIIEKVFSLLFLNLIFNKLLTGMVN